MDDIIENNFLKIFLKKTLEKSQNHHFLFYGLPGCGKTTLTRLYLKEKHKKRENYIEINSSDNRGINYYKDVLMKFIDNKTIKNKTIFLDEADNLTNDSQLYINNIIEYINDNNMDTRFIVVCNYINNIDENILNKCFVFRFKNMTEKNIKKVFNEMIVKNNLKIKNKTNLIKSFNNDFRNLNFYFNLKTDIYQVKDYDLIYKKIIKYLLSDKKIDIKYKKIEEILINENIENILDNFFKYCLNNTNIEKKKLIEIFYKIKNNLGLDYNKKLKFYEIIFSFLNI